MKAAKIKDFEFSEKNEWYNNDLTKGKIWKKMKDDLRKKKKTGKKKWGGGMKNRIKCLHYKNDEAKRKKEENHLNKNVTKTMWKKKIKRKQIHRKEKYRSWNKPWYVLFIYLLVCLLRTSI